MGGEAWGGAAVPASLQKMFNVVNGLSLIGEWVPEANGPWRPYNFRSQVETMFEGGSTDFTSPYSNAVLHDPNPELDDALSRLEDADLLLQMFDPETDWEALFATVKARIDADLTWEGDIDAVVLAFDTALLPGLQRSKARQQAQICEMGGVNGTAFFMSGAMLEKAHTDKVAEYRAQMLLESKKLRASIILQAVAQLFEALRYRIESNRIMAQMRLQFATTNIAANSDLVANQLKVDVQADMWNLNLLSEVKAVNILGGAPTLQKGLEPWQAALSLGLNALGGGMNVIPGIAGALK